ncbi:Protein LURP-one-related 8 [Apostasia shenzhenica]|uniref:Protein LURP-one-related 8 n=1 Tax=Apostasia shenzhenica TaxID=1088818 RepID=A0A2I0ASM9_9ASPA|nr:Protein LURP-one-related 8 [Apostasia shenzhenica]
MAKRIHPNAGVFESKEPRLSSGDDRFSTQPLPAEAPVALTVWRKSLLFNCSGFTVFNEKGNLVFRVDKYAKSSNKGEIDLMDAVGNPILTIRRKMLSLGERWQIYDGDEAANPRFSVRKHVSLLQSRSLAHMTPCAPPVPEGKRGVRYEIEGSYANRSCMIYDERRRPMAEIRRKEAVSGAVFGLDVFRLVVQPGFDAALAMAAVILLEEMFGSKSSLIRSRSPNLVAESN